MERQTSGDNHPKGYESNGLKPATREELIDIMGVSEYMKLLIFGQSRQGDAFHRSYLAAKKEGASAEVIDEAREQGERYAEGWLDLLREILTIRRDMKVHVFDGMIDGIVDSHTSVLKGIAEL